MEMICVRLLLANTCCGFYFEENIPINDFPQKKNQIYIFKAYKRSNLFKNLKILEIADDHNYAEPKATRMLYK